MPWTSCVADTQDDQQRYMEALELSAVLLVGGPLAGTSSLSPAGVAGTKTIATTTVKFET